MEAELRAALGYAVPTFLRSDAEIRAIVAQRPFAPELVRGFGGKLQVSLLGAAPPAREREQVLAMAGEEDRLAFAGRELYWLPRGGVLESALDLDAIARVLGASTMRTKNTIEQLARKHFPPA